MSNLEHILWDKAMEALHTAKHDLSVSADATASRAYYAAFYAISAHFAIQGRSFKKHASLEAAVHRDLVRTGLWPKDLGEGFSRLVKLRYQGDYGTTDRVIAADAERAIQIAGRILEAVADANPSAFQRLFD
ncbi:MAG: HEPN domain-containing protein [Planctomycetota bacterium]|nr:HEPN domain-containing protein [Planctomycetota bacterium]